MRNKGYRDLEWFGSDSRVGSRWCFRDVGVVEGGIDRVGMTTGCDHSLNTGPSLRQSQITAGFERHSLHRDCSGKARQVLARVCISRNFRTIYRIPGAENNWRPAACCPGTCRRTSACPFRRCAAGCQPLRTLSVICDPFSETTTRSTIGITLVPDIPRTLRVVEKGTLAALWRYRETASRMIRATVVRVGRARNGPGPCWCRLRMNVLSQPKIGPQRFQSIRRQHDMPDETIHRHGRLLTRGIAMPGTPVESTLNGLLLPRGFRDTREIRLERLVSVEVGQHRDPPQQVRQQAVELPCLRSHGFAVAA